MKKFLLSCLIALSTAGSLASANAATPLNVAVVGNASITYWDLYAAADLGYFADKQLDVKLTGIDTGAQVAQALVTGAIDIASVPAEVAISAIEKGADLAIVGAENAKPHFSFMVGPGISGYQDLKGKALAVSQMNEAGVTILRKLLAQHGLKQADYSLVQLGANQNRLAGLVKGVVQGTFLSPPLDYRAAESGAHRLGYLYEAFEGPYMVYTVRRSWAAEHAGTVSAFLQAVIRASRWLHDPVNRDAAIKVAGARAGARPGDAAQAYDAFFGPSGIMADDVEISERGIQAYLDLRGGKPPKPAGSFLDTRYRVRALQALK